MTVYIYIYILYVYVIPPASSVSRVWIEWCSFPVTVMGCWVQIQNLHLLLPQAWMLGHCVTWGRLELRDVKSSQLKTTQSSWRQFNQCRHVHKHNTRSFPNVANLSSALVLTAVPISFFMYLVSPVTCPAWCHCKKRWSVCCCAPRLRCKTQGEHAHVFHTALWWVISVFLLVAVIIYLRYIWHLFVIPS